MGFTEHNPEAPKQFLSYAGMCIDAAKKSYGIELTYDLASIKKLDEMIEGMGKPKNLEPVVMVFGSFLGETIRQLYKGRWEWSEHYKTWGVTFPLPGGSQDSAFVFAKVQKRFYNGMEDSLSFLVEVTDQRVKGKIP